MVRLHRNTRTEQNGTRHALPLPDHRTAFREPPRARRNMWRTLPIGTPGLVNWQVQRIRRRRRLLL